MRLGKAVSKNNNFKKISYYDIGENYLIDEPFGINIL